MPCVKLVHRGVNRASRGNVTRQFDEAAATSSRVPPAARRPSGEPRTAFFHP